MYNEQKIKNLVNKKAKEYSVSPQQMYGLFGLEQLLLKINQSSYKDNFVVKGGFLLTYLYGLETRTTKDLDTTVRDLSLTEGKIKEFSDFIASPDENGKRYFNVLNVIPHQGIL